MSIDPDHTMSLNSFLRKLRKKRKTIAILALLSLFIIAYFTLPRGVHSHEDSDISIERYILTQQDRLRKELDRTGGSYQVLKTSIGLKQDEVVKIIETIDNAKDIHQSEKKISSIPTPRSTISSDISNNLPHSHSIERRRERGEDREREERDVKPRHSDTTTNTALTTTQVKPSSSTHPPTEAKLDAKSLRIMPKRPIVPEGHTLQVTCAMIALLSKNKSHVAPHVTFELPPLTPKLRQSVQMIVRPGLAALRFIKVRAGHEGVYKCKAIDSHGGVVYNSVTIGVIKKDGSEVDKNDLDDNIWAQHSMFGNRDSQDNTDRSQEIAEALKRRRKRPHKHMDSQSELDTNLESLLELQGSREFPLVNMTQMMERGKFQQEQVEKFCHHHNLDNLRLKLPLENESQHVLYRHLLINDISETVFCFMPKVGCTNLRVLFFMVQGYIPLTQLIKARDAVDQSRLESAQYMESFLNRNDNQRKYSISKYFKYIMYRNPLERLVSGYRSKVQRYPLQGLSDETPHYNWLRKDVLLWTNVEKYTEFLHDKGKTPINISFSDFIDYWARQLDRIKFNEHFESMFVLSHPCRVRYNFYGNFKHFESDGQVLVNKIGAQPEFIRSGYYSNEESTEKLSPSYYAQLDLDQKRSVLKILSTDLQFYYAIFPEERDVHKAILGVDLELPQSLQNG